jgi:outer membrane protein TolC
MRAGLRHSLLAGMIGAALLAAAPSRAAEESPQISLIDAIRCTLACSPDIRLQESRVSQAQGRVEEARGVFDETVEATFEDGFTADPLTSDLETALGYSSSRTHTTRSGLGVSRLFPSGLKAGPTVAYERIDDTAGSAPTANLATIDFTITLPIWRGRGEAVVMAGERSAEAAWQAQRMAAAHAASVAVTRAVSSYWAYLAAFQSLEIARQSEGKAGELLGTIRLLVDADERPAADLLYLRANLASKSSARISAELDFRRARHALNLAMGRETAEIDQLGLPATDFPPFSAADFPEADHLESLMAGLAARRADLLGLDREKSAAAFELAAARDERRPKLDLEFTAGYTGLDEGSGAEEAVSTYGADGAGPHASLSLTYAWPVRRTAAIGRIRQAEAGADQATLSYADQLRKARAAVATAFDNVRISGQVLLKSQEAAAYYRQAVDGESVKLTQGMTTIIDYVSAGDDYINALRDVVSARLDYALALIALRFEAGAIIHPEYGASSLSLADLTSVP